MQLLMNDVSSRIMLGFQQSDGRGSCSLTIVFPAIHLLNLVSTAECSYST